MQHDTHSTLDLHTTNSTPTNIALTNSLTDDVPGDLLVYLGVALVQDHEEQVEATHDGRRHRHVRLERLRAVVAPEHWVGWCE